MDLMIGRQGKEHLRAIRAAFKPQIGFKTLIVLTLIALAVICLIVAVKESERVLRVIYWAQTGQQIN